MNTDYLNVFNLLIAILFIILLIVAAVAVSVIKNRKISATGSSSEEVVGKTFNEKTYSAGNLLKVRLFEGVDASLKYASEFERQLVVKLADDRYQEIADSARDREDLKLIERYEKKYCNNSHKLTASEIEDCFVELRSIQDAAGIKAPPIYDFLLKLSDYLDMANPLVLSRYLAKYEKAFSVQSVKDPQMKLLIDTVSSLAKDSAENLEALADGEKKEKQQAVANLTRAFQKALSDINYLSVDKSNTAQHAVIPEVLYFKQLLDKLLTIFRNSEIDLADRPVFHIELLNKIDQLHVDSDLLELKFVVSNEKHQTIQVKDINVYPVAHSDDLQYNGSRKNLELNNGKQVIDFSFRSFFLQKTDFDKSPTIEFTIEYFIKDKKFQDKVNYQLPEIVSRPRIINPFEVGKSGSGLPGDSPLFAGRQTLLQDISVNLLNFDSVPIYYLIYGLARSGKSSVLNQLAENNNWLKRKYIVVQVSGQTSQDVKYFFNELYTSVKLKLQEKAPLITLPAEERVPANSKAPAWQPIIMLLRQNEPYLVKNKIRILFLVDEYQDLARWDKDEDAPENLNEAVGYRAFQFPEFIKILRDEYGKVAAVIMAGHESLEQVARTNYYWIRQLGGRIDIKTITNFSDDEADELIIKNFENHQIYVSGPALKRIRAYTHSHPFFQVLMGYYIFQGMIDKYNYRQDRNVRDADVDNAAVNITSADMKFLWVDPWIQESPVESRVLLAAMAEMSYDYGVKHQDLTQVPYLTDHQVEDYLFQKYGVPHTYYDFQNINAHKPLIDYKVIDKDKRNESYRLLYPLLGIYAHKSNLVSDILNEVKKKR